MEMAHPLVPRLEITPEITARGKTGRTLEAISISRLQTNRPYGEGLRAHHSTSLSAYSLNF